MGLWSFTGELTSQAAPPRRSSDLAFPFRLLSYAFAVFALSFATIAVYTPSGSAQGAMMDCPNFEGQDFVMPPEFVSSGGVLTGTISLIDELRRLPREKEGAPCRGARTRVFQGEGLPLVPPAKNSVPGYADAIPGPTLRARIGDIVQLSFVNRVNPNRFVDAKSLDIEDCVKVAGGAVYPVGGASDIPQFYDRAPNCLHASSTANIHFHGTHTNPNSTGDNVYLQIRPLPRDNQGQFTTSPDQATAGFDEFFKKCTEELQHPLNAWPRTWGDVPRAQANKSWTDNQTELLVAYQQKNPGQRLWDKNKEVLNDSWPIYYIGAFPYCFALPAYTEEVWPPPPAARRPPWGRRRERTGITPISTVRRRSTLRTA